MRRAYSALEGRLADLGLGLAAEVGDPQEHGCPGAAVQVEHDVPVDALLAVDRLPPAGQPGGRLTCDVDPGRPSLCRRAHPEAMQGVALGELEVQADAVLQVAEAPACVAGGGPRRRPVAVDGVCCVLLVLRV